MLVYIFHYLIIIVIIIIVIVIVINIIIIIIIIIIILFFNVIPLWGRHIFSEFSAISISRRQMHLEPSLYLLLIWTCHFQPEETLMSKC